MQTLNTGVVPGRKKKSGAEVYSGVETQVHTLRQHAK